MCFYHWGRILSTFFCYRPRLPGYHSTFLPSLLSVCHHHSPTYVPFIKDWRCFFMAKCAVNHLYRGPGEQSVRYVTTRGLPPARLLLPEGLPNEAFAELAKWKSPHAGGVKCHLPAQGSKSFLALPHLSRTSSSLLRNKKHFKCSDNSSYELCINAVAEVSDLALCWGRHGCRDLGASLAGALLWLCRHWSCMRYPPNPESGQHGHLASPWNKT